MISFSVSLVALILGYLLYGRFVEKVFGPDDRVTPAVAKADGIDYIVLPNWKIFMIQFLNIAGTGPIFGAIMGAQFGPAAYLWIVLGCIFAGSVHDYLSGMLSLRNGGINQPEIIGSYLGKTTKKVMLVFAVFLLMMVGAVFVYSPATLLQGLCVTHVPSVSLLSDSTFWIIIIFVYYLIATMLPIDKIIGKVYPLFAVSLLFMAAALLVMLFVKHPDIPEIWEGLSVEALTPDAIFPCLFITIACGAISGFHATQSPLMARCMKSEKQGRPIFYGAMITEGIVALIWATVAMYFFYDSPTPGSEQIAGGAAAINDAPSIVNLICNDWLGVVGGILALLGVVAAPITSGDTAFRSARLIIADFLKVEQRSIRKRLYVCIPMFAAAVAILVWQMNDKEGFNILWSWFGWSNQTMSVFMLWAVTVFLVQQKKPFIVMLIPALFMTTVCSTFIFVSPQAFAWSGTLGYSLGVGALVVALVWFFVWFRKQTKTS
jgi:carbon starvation protein CstA